MPMRSSKTARRYKPITKKFAGKVGDSFVKSVSTVSPNHVEESVEVCKPGDTSKRCRTVNYSSYGDGMNGGATYSSDVFVSSKSTHSIDANNYGRTKFHVAGNYDQDVLGNTKGAFGEFKAKVHGYA